MTTLAKGHRPLPLLPMYLDLPAVYDAVKYLSNFLDEELAEAGYTGDELAPGIPRVPPVGDENLWPKQIAHAFLCWGELLSNLTSLTISWKGWIESPSAWQNSVAGVKARRSILLGIHCVLILLLLPPEDGRLTMRSARGVVEAVCSIYPELGAGILNAINEFSALPNYGSIWQT